MLGTAPGRWPLCRAVLVPCRRLSTRVRFAPSPTGYLHVGGLRTALLNYLFARRTGGAWVLRIEDTDQSRLVPGATEALQEALAWAGLTHDEGPDCGGPYGPYVQSQRLPLYRTYSDRLLASGHAYCDFRPPVPREQHGTRAAALLREAYLPPPPAEAAERIARGERHVVRLRMDPTRTYTYRDVVYGELRFPPDASVADDPILVKSDGWPTYHLASVVDDTEMRITHVLRGEEWIPSMPKHLALYEALQLVPPHFVHLPLLVNADGSKLSKRSGDVRVEDYRSRGYEPETLVNLVALTGYSHVAPADADDRDVMSMDDLVAHFDLERISHSRATLPLDKLAFLNRRHLALKLDAAATDAAARRNMLTRLRPAFAPYTKTASDDRLLHAAELGKVRNSFGELTQHRADTLPEIPAQVAYIFREPDWAAEECARFRASVPTASFRRVVGAAQTFFANADPSDGAAGIHAQLQAWMPTVLDPPLAGGKAAVQKSLRIALTGMRAGPPIADVASALGLDHAAARLARALAWDKHSVVA